MPIEILLVEDNPGDVRLAKEAFRIAHQLVRWHVVWDGVEAMEFLGRQGAYADATRPDIIFLDLDLPRMDGREVLALVQKEEILREIPVLVVSAFGIQAEAPESYLNGARGFLSKPVRWDEFESLLKKMYGFWLTNLELPNLATYRPLCQNDGTREWFVPPFAKTAKDGACGFHPKKELISAIHPSRIR